MIRLPVAAFVALGVATLGAFFLTQHLKVTTPLINGFPAPVPSTINPVNGGTCKQRGAHNQVVWLSYKRMKVSFYLQNRGDVVYVYIVNQEGRAIRTLPGSGRYLKTFKRRTFVWDGRETDGSVAPDGSYDIQVSLAQQGRKLDIARNNGTLEPVTVQTQPPRLAVVGVTPRAVAVPGRSVTTIRYTGNQGLRPQILILRVAGGGRPRLVKSYAATSKAGTSQWNGTMTGGVPAPPGTYLVGLRLSPDKTCNTVQSALTPAAAPQAVVTVR